MSESRRIARQRLAIRDSVKMSASAIRRFGDSVIPRIRGCQPDRARPGRAQRRSYAAQATQATHLGATSRSNKFLSGLICIVNGFPRKVEPMRYLVTCSGCKAASRLLRLCLSACGARQAAPMHAYRRTPHLTSESTASTLRCGATLLIRLSIQLDYSDAAFTLTLTRAGPMPAAESAHNKTLQFPAIRVFSCPKKIVYKAGFESISAAKGMFVLQL